MNLLSKALNLSALCCFACGAVIAQQATPAKSTAQAEAGEPRADTSRALLGGAAPASPEAGIPAAGVMPNGNAADATPTVGASAAAKVPGKAAARPRGAGEKPTKTSDHVDLDTTTVTGNRELPKVLYIVPWKKSDIGDLLGKPMNSLLDEVLAPVDRDVFRREVIYYRAVSSDATQNGAPGAQPGKQGEK